MYFQTFFSWLWVIFNLASHFYKFHKILPDFILRFIWQKECSCQHYFDSTGQWLHFYCLANNGYAKWIVRNRTAHCSSVPLLSTVQFMSMRTAQDFVCLYWQCAEFFQLVFALTKWRTGEMQLILASRAMALNSIPLRGERSVKWYECLTLNADGRIWTHRPCSPWHISFQDCALITIWVRRHNGNALCKACLFLESTHRLYHSHNADSRTWTYTPSFDGYWRFSKPFPYQLGLYLQNRRRRDQQAAADNSLFIQLYRFLESAISAMLDSFFGFIISIIILNNQYWLFSLLRLIFLQIWLSRDFMPCRKCIVWKPWHTDVFPQNLCWGFLDYGNPFHELKNNELKIFKHRQNSLMK